MAAAFAIWLTGLPASGKSTITRALVPLLQARGADPVVLESDALRQILTPRPTYSEEERETFYRAMTYIGTLCVEHGVPVIFDATANRRAYRAGARTAIARFLEVHVDTSLDVCMRRDPKGIYRTGRAGGATNVPGLQTPYEAPEHPDLVVHGDEAQPDAAAQSIVRALESRGFLTRTARTIGT